MNDGNTSKNQGRFERPRRGFFRRNWLVLLAALVALVISLGAVGYGWLLPTVVEKVVRDLEGSLGRIAGAEVVHEAVRVEGLDRMVMEGLAVTVEGNPLVRVERAEVDFDPFAFTEGLPTVLQVTFSGVAVSAVRFEDGRDNVTPVLRALAAYLARERTGEGEASRLARLLRQMPVIEMDDLQVAVALEEGGERAEVLRLARGTLRAENPNLSRREREYAVEIAFLEANGASRATIQADLDISDRAAQVQADFSPPMYLAVKGQEVQVEQFRFRSGEFVELSLGRMALSNPLADASLLQALVARTGGNAVGTGLAGRLQELVRVDQLIDGLFAKVRPQLVRLGYPKGVWEQYVQGIKRSGTKLVQRLLSEADGDRLVIDSARILYLVSETRSGALQEKLKLSVKAGSSGGGEVSVVHRAADDYTEATFDVVSPSRLFQVSGELEKEGERLDVRADLTASLLDPYFQVKGTLFYKGGELEGDFRAQLKNDEPPLALSADLLMRGGRLNGNLEGEFTIPHVLHARLVKMSFRDRFWTADVSGSGFPPDGSGPVEFQVAFDSQQGLKRVSATSQGDVRVPLGGYDVLLSKVRMGRDAVVHFEDVAVVRSGADRGRAVVQVADLAFNLTHKGLELVEAVRNLDFEVRPETLLGQLISSVEIIAPTIELRQPPRLSMDAEAAVPDTAEDLADKIEDALEEGSGEAVVMHEPYRKALAGMVDKTGQAVQGFVRTMLKLGDRFPLERVEVKEGRFEYSDAVSPKDRLLTELSNFNASISKVKRAGNLGGKFTIRADFSTAVANEQAGSSLEAEVDLATGDMKGLFKVEKMALFPYRFFLPSLFAPSRVSFLEDASVGFAYMTEADRFRVWGHGRITDFNVVSRQIAPAPLEHLDVEFSLGDDASNGLLFELGRKRFSSGGPMFATFGKIRGISAEFAIDAETPDFPTFELNVRIPETSVNDLLDSIPKALGSYLEGMRVEGRLGLELEAAGNSRNLRDMTFRVTAQENGIKLEAPGRHVDFNMLTGDFRHRPPTDRERVVLVGAGPDFVPLSRISPWLVLAVTTTEDGSFFRHEGFNTFQLKMSVIRNLEKGRFARGASTITMQLVKNLFLSHDKTLSRKLQEILLTWLIEQEIRKDKLIEVYLNVIEWGDGIYGVKEACDFYFGGLPPENLSPAQAAFLASFIPYPRPFSARFKEGMFGRDRSKRWMRWWERRQKLVKRIVRAMVNNCHKLDSKCPMQLDYCRILAATCRDPGRELIAADNVTNLDELFRPVESPDALPDNPPLEL
jgi:hypothetical protein